eukprot:g968.t1
MASLKNNLVMGLSLKGLADDGVASRGVKTLKGDQAESHYQRRGANRDHYPHLPWPAVPHFLESDRLLSSGKDPAMVSETLLSTTTDFIEDRFRLGDPYAASEQDRICRLKQILTTVPHVVAILETVRSLDLPDAWLVSGGVYQTVWNVLTNRPLMHGIKDFDIIYFDGQDLSYEAEDSVIQRVNAALPELAELLEVRNQARVHLWYEQRFGRPYRPLDCAMDSLTTYAARTHAVAARMDEAGELVLHAPFGLANLFAMRLVPNYVQPNETTYVEKAERMKAHWPELTIAPWGSNV